MSDCFPAAGSLHSAQDVVRVAGKLGNPLKDKLFYMGSDVRPPLWYGRSLLDVDQESRTSLSAFFPR